MNGRNQISVATAGDARRAQIVHAAREICLEKGFSKITVSDIAGRVGMTRSLFYHYFQDKDQVADAVLDDVIDEVITVLEEWNRNREVGNISKALDDVVRLTRGLINDEGPFSQRMIADGTLTDLAAEDVDKLKQPTDIPPNAMFLDPRRNEWYPVRDATVFRVSYAA